MEKTTNVFDRLGLDEDAVTERAERQARASLPKGTAAGIVATASAVIVLGEICGKLLQRLETLEGRS